MGDWLFTAALVAAIATLVVLTVGIGGFGAGKMSGRNQNKMMWLRIIGQATAIVFLFLAFYFKDGG